MKTWIITRPEVYIQPLRVKADTKEEAVEKAMSGEETDVETLDDQFEYSHTIDDKDQWGIYEDK